jgi:hypothetical protein
LACTARNNRAKSRALSGWIPLPSYTRLLFGLNVTPWQTRKRTHVVKSLGNY